MSPRAQPAYQGNPWGLTRRESEVMDALCAGGCQKLVARKLDISAKTVEVHMNNVSKKINLPFPLLRLLAWDRWRRGGEKHDTSQ